ncbi:MAG: phospholipase [Rhodocyclales bacterium]|nr:phospholipase [Rhodocyclales bacterium]
MTDPIKHVVVLMQENRSFDQMLGALTAVYPQLEGVPPRQTIPQLNSGVPQLSNAVQVLDPGPRHDYANVMRQMANDCGGFIDDYRASFDKTSQAQWAAVMGYYRLDFLPVLHTLARNGLICDHWFSSIPGPTWPNRFFMHSGTSQGKVSMPDASNLDFHIYDQDTLFDRLAEKSIPWRIYHHGLPQSLVLTHQWQYAARYSEFDKFIADTQGAASDFPAYCFIEPDYSGQDENDQHPPSNVMNGEALIARVYNALRANEALWNETLFVLLYDEHGGFYDHVVPPAAIAPDDKRDASGFGFDQYGPRVPAVLVSPWIDAGVATDVFDHTSVLRYLCDKWNLAPLGRRAAQANSFARYVRTSGTPRVLPPHIATPPLTSAVFSDNSHDNALSAFARFLDEKLACHPVNASAVAARAAQDGSPSSLPIDLAKARFRAFLEKWPASAAAANNA